MKRLHTKVNIKTEEQSQNVLVDSAEGENDSEEENVSLFLNIEYIKVIIAINYDLER